MKNNLLRLNNQAKKQSSKRGVYFENMLSLILIFQLLALILVIFHDRESLTSHRLIFSLSLVAVVFLGNSILPKVSKGDHYLLMTSSMLFSIGVIVIYRLDPGNGIKQIVWFTVGLLAYYMTQLFLKKIDGWEKWTAFYLGLGAGLFAITFLFGRTINGANNWITITAPFTFSFQPSEITKIALTFFISSYYFKYDKFSKMPFGKYYMCAAVYVFIGFLAIQKDLGTAIIFFGLMMCYLFIFENDRKMILINLGLAIVGAVFMLMIFSHIRVRIITWIDPWSHIDDLGYQITQSLFAVSSGGFFGSGIGLGRPDLIPLPDSDFIFASICEEMGIFMGMAVVMLFLILVYRGYKIALEQKNLFFKLVAFGISTLFAVQALIIVAGVLKLIPLTGVTIPFVSYGGSSILSSFILLGVLQYTSEEINPKEEYDSEKSE